MNKRLVAIAGTAFVAYCCGVGFVVVLPPAGMAYVFWAKG